ncbi:hypothetical protein J6S88_00840 [bacterium]|nr:hypothetical protein [bacterium]
MNYMRVRVNSGISEKYPRAFLKTIRNYGLPCPICGENMISLDIFHLPAPTTLKYLAPYTYKMTDTNRRLYYRLKAESEKFPDLTVQGLLIKMAPQAERAVDVKRLDTLNDFMKNIFSLPGSRKKILAGICNRFMAIVNQNLPEKKDFNSLFNAEIVKFFDSLNLEQREYYKKIWYKMPHYTTNVNAAILELKKRGSKSSLMDIYSDPFAVLGHIKPYRDGGDIAIWECNRDNTLIKTFPLHLIAKEAPFTIENMKAHVTRLVQIYKDTLGKESKAFSELLKDYIIAVEKDIRTESKNAILPDISELFK